MSGSSPSNDKKIAQLVQTLRETEQQLQELTGGGLDAISGTDGKPYLLHDAQKKLRESERAQRDLAHTQTAVLNALPAHVALIDAKGLIVSVNESWREFAAANALQSADSGVGKNYLELCESVTGEEAEEAEEVATGIRSILNGKTSEFSLEYPCHSPNEKRWFRLMATPLQEGEPGGAVVMHVDITQRKLAEELLENRVEQQKGVAELSLDSLRATSLDDVFDIATHLIAKTLNTEFSSVLRLEADDVCLRVVSGVGWEPGFVGTTVVEAEGTGQAGFALRADGPVYVTDLRTETRFQAAPMLLDHGVVSAISVALRLHGKPWGLLSAHSRSVRHFSHEDIHFMQSVAGLLSVTIERLSAQDALADSEARMKNAQRIARLGNWELDLSTNRLTWSDEVYRIFGVERSDFSGSQEAFLNLVHPDDREQVRDARQAALKGGDPLEVEHRLIRPDGETRFVRERAELVREPSHSAVILHGTVLDITESKQAEQALAESEALFSTAFQSSPLPMMLATPDGNCVEANPAFHRLIGYSREEVTGKRASDLGVVGIGSRKELLAEIKKTGSVKDKELRLRHRDGTFRDVLGSMEAVSLQGAPHLLMTGIDITERKQADRLQAFESRVLKAISSSSPLTEILETVALGMVDLIPKGMAAIFLVDNDGQYLKLGAAPNLPDAYRKTLDPLLIEPSAGSCGAALCKRELVVVNDIESDPLWANDREPALEHGLHACSALPVLNFAGEPLAVFALYYRDAGEPRTEDIDCLHRAADLLQLAIERDRKDRELRASEERFRRTFLDAATGIAIHTVEGRFLEANAAYCRMVGYTEEELREIGFPTLTHPDDQPRTQKLMRELLSGERTSFVDEKRYLTKNGDTVWARTSLALQADASGRPVRIIAVAEDITRQKEAEAIVQKNQSVLWMASKLTHLGGWEVSLPDGTMTWSEEVRAIHEVSADYVPKIEEAIEFYAPEDRDEIRARFKACAEEGIPYDLELQIITAKGRRVWVRTIGEAVRGDEGNLIGVRGAFQDINERKEVENSLAASEARFRQLAESMPMIVWTATPSGEIDYSNHNFSDYTGVPREEPPATRWQNCLHPDDVERCLAEWQRCVANTEPFEIEYRIRRGSDGSFRWFRVQAMPVRNDQGEIVKWYGTGIDVHETKILEAKATRLAERFTTTLESITDAFYTLDRDWRFTYVNAEAERLLERPRDELIGRVVWDEFKEAVGTTIDREYHRAVQERATVTFEELYPPLEKWFEINAYPSEEGLAVYFRDVTERRKNRQALVEQATLLDKAQDAILVCDLDQNVLYWNKSAERLYGWTEQEAVGASIENLFQKDPAPLAAAAQVTLEEGEWTGEMEHVTKDGQNVAVEGRWTLVSDEEGNPKSILSINTDVTERKKLETQFLRAQRLESIGTLAGGIAHDLNNLLSPIVMGVGLLQQIDPREDAQSILQTIEESAQRGTDLVKQVLSFARGVEGARVSIQLHHIVREVESIIKNTFPKNIAFEADVRKDLWTTVGDPTQLNQVILNLCVNARDAMEQGGRLKITAENVEVDDQFAITNRGVAGGSYVALAVIDDGQGMPKEVVDRVFEPFFTTKETGKGTGLGLSTVLGIVRSHGGFVNVYSEVGKGSVFKVYLPATESTTDASHDHSAVEKLPRGKGERILVVDDEASVLNITKQTLESFGYRVLEAEDGAQAIGVFVQNRNDIALVMTDMMMPVMDGPALIAALRRITPEVRIIAASGLNDKANIAKASNAGVDHFLSKPYSAKAMLLLVNQVLSQPAQE